jgi:NCAIR mutase (PurE)-related protein
VDPVELKKMLNRVRAGKLGVSDAMKKLKDLPFAELGFATVDTHRSLRLGFPEVVLGQWKTAEHCVRIAEALDARGGGALVTRLQPEKAAAMAARFPHGIWHETARIFQLKAKRKPRAGNVAVVCAGTSDLPVAEEAAVTAEAFGAKVTRVTDVGVAGIHRLLKKRHHFDGQHAIVAVAGMEGALASALGGLVGVPVVAVPTSVGYGGSFDGVTTLLAMMTACASNVAVVNIDNGFGAGFYAALISRTRGRR